MTPWELEIVTVLANQLRTLSVDQLARTWWEGQSRARRNALESAKGLQRGGWVSLQDALSRPVAPLDAPLVVWMAGEASPNFQDLSRRLFRRARDTAHVTQVLNATERARTLLGSGGGPRRIKLTQLTHDLYVSEVLLNYRQRGFDLRRWVAEGDLTNAWPLRQRPDAVLLDAGSQSPQRAIEYGGAYTVQRLTTLHNALASIGLSYEIW